MAASIPVALESQLWMIKVSTIHRFLYRCLILYIVVLSTSAVR